ncbi:hypothetical protein AOQ84DRAFT_351659 [Glonium stellatum]|uniref:DUF7704 domain-containing protein n=1 Tax=Glonium stellatum TaxID=574774 RepID=A0A8E2FBZ0_9PEZI|nr:hypothetical protein AOQ84DRAFT_351659 [Glonium stellatum]
MSSTNIKIPLPYRLFHQTLEPIFALSGAYMALFRTPSYLQTIAPPSAYTLDSTLSPVSSLLLAHEASLYVQFALCEVLVLRLTSDIRIWRALVFSLLFSDIGHLYAAYLVLGPTFWNMQGWRSQEWTNLGTLWFGLALRVAFMCGIGMEKSKSEVRGRRVKTTR